MGWVNIPYLSYMQYMALRMGLFGQGIDTANQTFGNSLLCMGISNAFMPLEGGPFLIPDVETWNCPQPWGVPAATATGDVPYLYQITTANQTFSNSLLCMGVRNNTMQLLPYGNLVNALNAGHLSLYVATYWYYQYIHTHKRCAISAPNTQCHSGLGQYPTLYGW